MDESGIFFAVQVQFDVCMGQHGRPVGFAVLPQVAQEVGHGGWLGLGGRSQRQAAYGAYLLFELAGDAGVNGKMPRVMHPWGDFIDEQRILACEKALHAHDADHVKRFQHATGNFNGFLIYGG